MEFTLKYRGPLPGGSASGRVEHKHSIRKAFHEQLADYWQRDTRLKGLKPSDFHQAQRSDNFAYDVPRPVQGTQNFFYRTSCRGIDFVPLVIRIRYMECELQIDWHRHDPPGTILSPNGDIDNRLKTLFDALRMPQNETEIPSDASHDGMFFCLLEDDSLITKLSVSSRRLRYSPADILGEHTVEATSDRVEGTRAHRDELWDQCYESLMQHARSRMEQVVARLEGDYAHVLHESVDSRHDDVKGEAWLRGAFTYVLYRRAR